MNKAQTKYAIEVMQAYLDGKPIEHKYNELPSVSWHAVNKNPGPSWDWGMFNYRVKPEPRTFKVWVRGTATYPYWDTHEIEDWQSNGWELVEVVEKLP